MCSSNIAPIAVAPRGGRAAVADGLQGIREPRARGIAAGVGEGLAVGAGVDAEPSIAGAKREPSSLVQLTSINGALVT